MIITGKKKRATREIDCDRQENESNEGDLIMVGKKEKKEQWRKLIMIG